MKENRLIDVDDLIDFINMGHLRNPLESCFSERDVVDMLESRPTVDAVEVVRCKNCKYSEKESDNCTFNYFCHYDGCAWNNGDHFCGYGERVEADAKQ